MRNAMTVIGMRRVEFTTKDNINIKGYTFYMTFDDDNVTGQAATKEFLSDHKVTDPITIGDKVIVRYNRYGKVESLDLV